MIVVCPSCSSRFQYDESRFLGAPSKRFRCPKCEHIFEVLNPEASPQADPAPAPPPPAPRQEGTLSFPAPFPQGADSTARRDRVEMQPTGVLGTLPAGMRFTIAFLNGPHASTVRVLDQPTTIFGREEGDIITQDPETSRRHARLEIHWDGSVWITDLGSTNGTFVDGIQITTPVRLTDRQEFTCGKSAFMLLVRNEDLEME